MALVELAENWNGPLSVALFTPDIELDIALRYIVFLRRCFQPIRDQVNQRKYISLAKLILAPTTFNQLALRCAV
jgi:hypothetical protein